MFIVSRNDPIDQRFEPCDYTFQDALTTVLECVVNLGAFLTTNGVIPGTNVIVYVYSDRGYRGE